jgi:hypothetical protein
MLLKVAFIQAPQFDVGTASQAAELFFLLRLSADPIERLEAAACVAESPFVETVADMPSCLAPTAILTEEQVRAIVLDDRTYDQIAKT